MIIARLLAIGVIFFMGFSLLISWNITTEFDAFDQRWWIWAGQYIKQTGTLPIEMMVAVYAVGISGVVLLAVILIVAKRARTTTTHGGRKSKDMHGSARWATYKEIKKAGLLNTAGVIVGGFPKRNKTRELRSNGPEHILAFAPTGSGKGVGLVLPTLFSWEESALILDIKGENHALSAGWRASQGHKVFKFAPASAEQSHRYNPLTEIKIETGEEIKDCQNIASMIIDPEGKGLKDFWMQSGYSWLSAVILHVCYRIRDEEKRTATLADVYFFMSGVEVAEEVVTKDGEIIEQSEEDGFEAMLDEMIKYHHGTDASDKLIHGEARSMKNTAHSQRSGVHATAKVPMALYADPIISTNTSECDFRISDLMQSDKPISLYLVVPPTEIDRLRPLIRIFISQFLMRLMAKMEFEQGKNKKDYNHRVLLMLDEFTSLGKLEIFQKAMAYMRGYGLKAFIIVQDVIQLHDVYGKNESITSNCGIRIAYAPNNVDTQKMLSEMVGKTTIVQKKQSNSYSKGLIGGSSSESISEVSRPLLTPDECASMDGLVFDDNGNLHSVGDMLIFKNGFHPVYGQQYLFFKDKDMLAKSKIPPPEITKLSVEKQKEAAE